MRYLYNHRRRINVAFEEAPHPKGYFFHKKAAVFDRINKIG